MIGLDGRGHGDFRASQGNNDLLSQPNHGLGEDGYIVVNNLLCESLCKILSRVITDHECGLTFHVLRMGYGLVQPVCIVEQ